MKHRTRENRRQAKTGAKAVDRQCQNNGDCDYCKSNRQHKINKAKAAAEAAIQEYEYGR